MTQHGQHDSDPRPATRTEGRESVMLSHEGYSVAKEGWRLGQYEPAWAGLEITLLSEKSKLQVRCTKPCYLCKTIIQNSFCL